MDYINWMDKKQAVAAYSEAGEKKPTKKKL